MNGQANAFPRVAAQRHNTLTFGIGKPQAGDAEQLIFRHRMGNTQPSLQSSKNNDVRYKAKELQYVCEV